MDTLIAPIPSVKKVSQAAPIEAKKKCCKKYKKKGKKQCKGCPKLRAIAAGGFQGCCSLN